MCTTRLIATASMGVALVLGSGTAYADPAGDPASYQAGYNAGTMGGGNAMTTYTSTF